MNVPGAHAVHAGAPAAAKVPAMQGAHTVEPGGANDPGAHAVQVPSVPEVPAGQFVHMFCPAADIVPALQAAQVVVPADIA